MAAGMHGLKLFVHERLTAAAQEILIHVEKTISEYEEKMLQIHAHTAGIQQLVSVKEEQDPPTPSTPPHIKLEPSLTELDVRLLVEEEEEEEEEEKNTHTKGGEEEENDEVKPLLLQTLAPPPPPPPHSQPLTEQQPSSSDTDHSDQDDEEDFHFNQTSTTSTVNYKPFKCSVGECGTRFCSSKNLEMHMRSHKTDDQMSCRQIMDQERDAMMHASSSMSSGGQNDNDKPFKCSVGECGSRFCSSKNLEMHMRSHGMDQEASERDMMHASSSMSSSRNNNEGDIDNDKPFKCSVGECGSRFCSSKNLKMHMRSHTADDPLSCPVCGKTFLRKGHARRHMSIHTGEKPFSCSECGKSFNRDTHLKRHMYTHTGERPFSCPFCLKAFTHKGNLTQHLVVHTGEKPYQCSLCEGRFSWDSQLRKHKCPGGPPPSTQPPSTQPSTQPPTQPPTQPSTQPSTTHSEHMDTQMDGASNSQE